MDDYTQGFSTFAAPDLAAAKAFYSDVLGLEVGDEREGVQTLMLPGGARVMMYEKSDHEPAVFTVLTLAVSDLPKAVDALSERGATWERYEGFEQDERGIVSSPEFGPDIAWTTDPAGNIIALMQLEAGQLP